MNMFSRSCYWKAQLMGLERKEFQSLFFLTDMFSPFQFGFILIDQWSYMIRPLYSEGSLLTHMQLPIWVTWNWTLQCTVDHFLSVTHATCFLAIFCSTLRSGCGCRAPLGFIHKLRRLKYDEDIRVLAAYLQSNSLKKIMTLTSVLV